MIKFATIQKLVAAECGVHAWALDFPQADTPVRIGERGLYLQGWVLTQADVVRGSMVVRAGTDGQETQRLIPFNNARPDVIQRVLGLAPDGHPQLCCGFIAWLADIPQDFTLGVSLDGKTTWLCQVQLHGNDIAKLELPEAQVIQGSAGWLFLDNDTNRSVDQYTGKLTLDQAGLARWQTYLDASKAIAGDAGVRHALVVAASKEQVLPEHYPHKKGAITVHEQVLALCQPEHHVVDTAALLAAHADREVCFIKTDTHWTDRGAMLATLAVLQELGLDTEQARQQLACDVYYTMPFAGDLGVKLTPALTAPTEFLQAPPAASDAVFDNHLPNLGRVLIFEMDAAVWPLSLLIFGASSSYPMLKFLKRLFSRIVFVHSAGNVDADIVRHECADFLLMQTTARFMVEPPGTAFSLRDTVMAKIGNVGEDIRGRAVASAMQAAPDAKNLPYLDMLELPT